MGREKRTAPGVGPGDHAKERHKRDRRGNLIDWTAPLPPGLVARPEKPQLNSKHKSWFEFVENKDKKKKLEFEFTERRDPPPGFEFVPIGNPALTTACKELSRDQDAMIFIVTSVHGLSKRLSSHLNRVGHHIRQTIVEQARATLGSDQLEGIGAAPGLPEPIPDRQEDINKQADAAIRDLFPRIPNTDRQMIIEHAFNKSRPVGKDGPPVGLAPGLTLSRRVQLAVLAHIRHNHTRYDQLLKETTYVNARKAVESLCLDILVKWRGDEETGRDQLDEILCEVIVISDSESEESDDDEEEEDESSASPPAVESPVDRLMRDEGPARATVPPVDSSSAQLSTNKARGEGLPRADRAPQGIKKVSRRDKRAAKWSQRGFHRYEAARDEAWHQALERQRLGNDEPTQSSGSQPWRTGEPGRPAPGAVAAHTPVELPYHAQRSYGVSLLSVDEFRERGSRVHDPQQPIPVVSYHIPQQVRMQEDLTGNGSRPVAEFQASPYGAAEVERVSYQGQDLKDYLVPSIEPASPESSNFSSAFPVPYHPSGPGLSHGVERPARVLTQPRVPTGTAAESITSQGYRAAYADEGFIRLPPRSDPGRRYIPPGQHSEPFILLNPQPVGAAGASGATATSGGSGLRYSSTWQDHASARDGGPSLRLGTRPDWIGHDGAILSSESRPIVIQDHPSPSRQQPMDFAYVSSENRCPSPSRWAGGRDRHHADSGIDQRIDTLRDEFVEIVRVSHKFPRQHEPRPVPAPTGRYDLPPTVSQPGTSGQPSHGFSQYDARHPPAARQRVERVVGRVEVPRFPDENPSFVTRPPDMYTRQERVVGIEYVQPRLSIEARTYSDRGPLHDTTDQVYRARSNSVVPIPYPGFPYQPHASRPTPKRDEVIMLD